MMETSFKSVVDNSKSILILLPTKPYFDQVASALSLFLSLRQQKDVVIYSPSQMTVEFNRLIGVNKISQEMGNRNMVMKFTDYDASNIERVSYDIENGQFKLTVIPKSDALPPTKNQVNLSYSGISSDTVIIIGGGSKIHFPALGDKELSGTKIVHIGIKDLTFSGDKNYISFSRPASSISEIVSVLLTEGGFLVDQDVATNLLMGIEEASNGLKSESTTADTFFVFSLLLRAGGRRLLEQQPIHRNDFPQGAIPSILPKNLSQNADSKQVSHPDDWFQPKIFKGTSVS